MATSGKKKVTKAQADRILADLDRKRLSLPGQGKSAATMLKESQAAARTREKTARAKVSAKARSKPTQKELKAADDARIENDLRKENRKGHGYDDLEEGQGKGKQAARDARRADEESEKLGEKRKPREGFLTKTLNFIGRTGFATVEAANDNQEKYYQERFKGKSIGSSLLSGFKAGFGGWGEGISGKKKTTFSQVIQEVADNKKANREGRGAANSVKGEAKVNGFLKYGLGTTLDIFGDPLTYAGVGLLGKAVSQGGKIVKAEEVVQNLKKTASVQKKLLNTGVASKAQLDEVMAVSRAPVEAIGRLDRKAMSSLKQDPDAFNLYKQILTERKAGPKFKRKSYGGETEHFGKRVEGLKLELTKPTQTKKAGQLSDDIAVKTALEELGNVGAKRNLEELIKGELSSGKYKNLIDDDFLKYVKPIMTPSQFAKAQKVDRAERSAAKAAAVKKAEEGGLTEKALRDDLLAATRRNLSPEIKKQLKIRLGPASVGVKGTEKIGELLAKARHGKVENAVDTFNDTFRAMVKVAPSLGRLRNQELGRASDRIRSQLITHQKVWDSVDPADAKAAWKDWASPYPNGSNIRAGIDPVNGQVDNAADHIGREIDNLQAAITELKLTPNEVGAWIADPKIKIHATTVPGWKIGPNGKQTPVGNNSDWLVQYLKNNDKIDNPGRTLFALNAAVEHATAKRAVYTSAAQHFGVPTRKTTEFVGHTGSATLPNRLSGELAKSGYKSVDLPGTEDMLFHPDIADGLKKLDAIMNDRITMDKWLRALDNANQIFKGAVTRYNPSFHTRTLASELMLSYIGGMRNPAWSYGVAGKILRGRNRELLFPSAVDATAQAAYKGDRAAIGAANTQLGGAALAAAPAPGTTAKVVFRHPRFGNLTADQVWGIYKETGLKTGFATTDVNRSMDPLRRSGAISKVNDKLQDRFEDVEDFGRLAHFMDILKHSKHKTLDEAVADATETVLKYHLDYTAVTQFEKTWATRAMPFYKWLRLSTPMILESLMHNPGKAMVAPKVLAETSEMAGYDVDGFGIAPGGADALVPSWMREAGALPMFKAFGDNQFFNPAQTVPLYGVLAEGNRVQGEEGDPAIKSAAMSAFSKLTPFIRTPAELATDQSSVGGPPSNNYARYFANQTPQTALGGRFAAGTSDVDKRQQLLSFLANPGFQPNTPARMNSEAQVQKDLAVQHRRALKKKLGVDEP